MFGGGKSEASYFPNAVKVMSDVRVCCWKVEFRENHTHLATAVNASSTLRPDRALVSMKGTPNSCTVTENHELFKRLHHFMYRLNTSLTGSEIVWKHKGCAFTAVLHGRGNFLVLLRDLVQRWWMCLHAEEFVPGHSDDEWCAFFHPLLLPGWALSYLAALYCLHFWRKSLVKLWSNSRGDW